MQKRKPWTYSKSTCGYLVREQRSSEDLARIRKLRDGIFGDVEPHVADRLRRRDQTSQHLIVIEETTGEFVGSYRLTCSSFSNDYDASDSFELNEVMARPGIKLELSYVCVAKAHRSGAVIRMLLAAVRDFCRYHEVETIFGCASLATQDRAKALKVFSVLSAQKNTPRQKRPMAPLLRFYYHLGAVVLAAPLFDSDFNCYDFFMMLDLNKVPDFAWQRIMGL
ncbi:MAG: GNAT family N-acetyltransferase [Bdellovibrionales bacterium]